MRKKILFIDRDGTLIKEPADEQIDSVEKFELLPDVIPALLKLKNAGYLFVIVTNQDALGSKKYPEEKYKMIQDLMMKIFSSQGINFEDVLVCPHEPKDNCDCRKPKLGLVMDYILKQKFDPRTSYVIGDRATDSQLAKNMGLIGIRLGEEGAKDWLEIADKILLQDRVAQIKRKTKETDIVTLINLDNTNVIKINSGLKFFDHMLEQLAKHGGFSLTLDVTGDLDVDEHHTIEDVALVLGEGIRTALGDKYGVGRYGFLLPMDDAQAKIALDLSGRSYFSFTGKFARDRVGDLPTELVPHFFRSLADAIKANLHIEVSGENTHHMIEAIFKGVGRALRQAITKVDTSLPSTKGLL